MKWTPILLAGAALSLLGCASKNVTFVTRTSLSVAEVDTTPPEISIGANRIEGVYGPAYDSGGVPAVFAALDSNASIRNPAVTQVYATGLASEILTAPNDTDEEDVPELSGGSSPMFFGTNTMTGLKLGLNPSNNLPNFLFGFRREELSVIPVGEESTDGNETKRVYPSVLGAVQVETDRSDEGAGITTKTFFATGQSAVNQARHNVLLQDLVKEITAAKVATLAERYDEAKLLSYGLIDNYDKLDASAQKEVRERAMTIGVVNDSYAANIRAAEASGDTARAEKLFLMSVLVGGADDTARARKLMSLSQFTALKVKASTP